MSGSEKNEIEADVTRLLKAGADIETLLGLMRERGLGQTDSFLMLARAAGLKFGEAQRLVFESKTWADRLETNIELQKLAMQAWRELAEENDPDFKIEVEEEPDSPEE